MMMHGETFYGKSLAALKINEFWLVRFLGSKDHIQEMKTANSVLLSLFMTRNETPPLKFSYLEPMGRLLLKYVASGT